MKGCEQALVQVTSEWFIFWACLDGVLTSEVHVTQEPLLGEAH